jgi:hypothetical protein
MRRSLLSLAAVVLLTSSSLYAACGVERWTIKVGTDSQAPSIPLSTWINTTIYNMHSSAKPASLPATSRLSPREMNQYSIGGTLTKYVREGDSDYHLVIQDGSGRTMIVEIPSTACVGGGSPFGTRISQARAQFDARLTATTTMKTTSIPVTIRGIGFWDYIHGQTGVAPNGIEIHPVLSITFNGIADAGGSDDVYVPEVPMPQDMVVDNDGGRVHVYRGGEAIGDIFFHGGEVIENPRLEVVFLGEHWDDASKQPILQMARRISSDERFAQLARYGVTTSGLSIDSRQLEGDRGPRREQSLVGRGSQIGTERREMSDLDLQRDLATAIEAGRIQQHDENVVYLVVLDPSIDAAVGETRDWTSYHSQFHPTDLAMSYAVVRGGLTGDALREAMFASVARTLVNPAGNGWF